MNTAGTTSHGERSAAEIEREVERSRARLTDTVEELKDRVSPGQVVEQTMDWLRGSGGREFVGNIGAALRDNPVPVLLVAAGIGWLALAAGREARGAGHHAAPPHGQGAGVLTAGHPRPSGAAPQDGQEAGPGLAARAAEGIGTVAEAGRRAAHRTGEALHEAGETVRDLGHRARRSGGAAAEGIAEALERQPLLLGAIGLAIGAALGALLPASEAEDRLLGEARDRVANEAGEAWQEAKERLAEHGLTPERGAAALGEVARELRETAGAASSAAASGEGARGAAG